MADVKTWYGPHDCSECGGTIVKAAIEDGGAAFDIPERLLKVYQRGAESGDVGVVYPTTWTPHVHRVNNDRPSPPQA